MKKLYKKASCGDQEKIYELFNECYTKYAKLVYFIISKYIYNTSDIEDLTNEVFINFFNHLDSLDLNQNIKSYLTASAKNTAINFINKSNRIEYNEEYVNKASTQNNNAYDELVSEMSNCLTEEEIDIIISHAVYGIKFKDIAREYNKPLNTIISVYHRAIKKFRKYTEV